MSPVGKESFALEILVGLVTTATGVLQTKHAMFVSASWACCFSEGRRNCLTQLKHKTWPHLSAMIGLEALERVLRHEGQVLRDSLVAESVVSLNSIFSSFWREKGWASCSAEAGQVGVVLAFFATGAKPLFCTSGVSEGVQNEGSVGLAACHDKISI